MIKFSTAFICAILLVLSGTLTGCGPAKTDVFIEVAPNETAFVIPLEGSTEDQKRVLSVDYLNKSKIATKRIFLPLRKVDTGRWWFNYQYVPTMRVITVDRKPIRLIWEALDGPNGTKNAGTGIRVESRDSIGFTVGIDITAHITEEDAALFLYSFPTGDLSKILNDTIKSKSTEILSREFAKYNLEGQKVVYDKDGKLVKEAEMGAREQKGIIVDVARAELVDYFKSQGVTIDTFGLVGGLWYDDNAIQEAINANFASALDVENKRNLKVAQEQVNATKLSIAINDKNEALEFAKAAEARTVQIELEIKRTLAEAELVKANKWSGNLPANIMPSGGGFILNTGK